MYIYIYTRPPSFVAIYPPPPTSFWSYNSGVSLNMEFKHILVISYPPPTPPSIRACIYLSFAPSLSFIDFKAVC